jgi:hypothetical protein
MTELARHPDFRLTRYEIGRERAPLIVVDNLVADPDALIEIAAKKTFGDQATYYPGVRAKVPLTYQQFIIEGLRGAVSETFGTRPNALRFTACHFSLVTAPPDKLTYLQRLPHTDSLSSAELAFVHYLFRADLGGTAFYRHRKTGFEYVDEARFPEYLRHIEAEKAGPDAPGMEYINGDTPLYEQIGRQEGVFNRMLLYRRTSLHSGCIARNFVPDANPRTGRLSVNGFLV